MKCSEKTLWNHSPNCWPGKLKRDGSNGSNITLEKKFLKMNIFIPFGINLDCWYKIKKYDQN